MYAYTSFISALIEDNRNLSTTREPATPAYLLALITPPTDEELAAYDAMIQTMKDADIARQLAAVDEYPALHTEA